MRTSLNEIWDIEEYLLKQMPTGDRLVYEAKILVDTRLRMNVRTQEKLLYIIKLFHRKKLREEAESISHKIFADPEKKIFQQRIAQLFNT